MLIKGCLGFNFWDISNCYLCSGLNSVGYDKIFVLIMLEYCDGMFLNIGDVCKYGIIFIY